MMIKKLSIFLITLAFCAGVFFFVRPVPALASEGETLTVDSVWMEGDSLHIKVTDKQTGVKQTLELNLPEYAGSGDEYVAVQAVDMEGNRSNTIQFKKPYYKEPAEPPYAAQTGPDESEGAENGVPDSSKPFTPDGSGTVVDNVHDSDGKEFFSIKTDDGNVFYLIVDRERQTENVYLLNAVTEDDLLALAQPNSGAGSGAIPTPTPAPTPEQTATPTPEPETPPVAPGSGGIGSGSLIFIVIAALAVGAAGYYFKVLKPKKSDKAEETEDFDEADDDDLYGDYGDSGESEESGEGGEDE